MPAIVLAQCHARAANSAPMIVMFTDFGGSGPYVGQIEAVLARDAPSARRLGWHQRTQPAAQSVHCLTY